MTIWSVNNNYVLAELEERSTVNINLPLANPSNTTTELISGLLPSGLRLENNAIKGTPLEVDRPTTNTFVIRGRQDNKITDRTFFIKINGSDNPVWITDEGKLPIGANETFFILDNSLINYQLLATDRDLPAGDNLEFYLTKGELPPGIELTVDGRLIGIVDPILALDVNVVDGGYDATPFSQYPFDFAVDIDENSRVPRKINRNYEFEITVTDNVSYLTRRFEILVVGDDFARADNTIMRAANGIFTADMTYLRTPLWLTPSNLGIRRANNYLTIFLDTYSSSQIAGGVKYVLEPLNPDNSPSQIPPGLILDETTGEIAGRVPYQPAISRDYQFTVNAIRFTDNEGLITVFGTFIEDTLAGSRTVKISKVPTTTTDGLDDLRSLVGQTVSIDNNLYTIESVNDENLNYDTVTFVEALQINPSSGSLTIKRFAGGGTNFFFVNELSQFTQNFYNKRIIKYSDSESYKIDSIYPYVEWEITNNIGIELVDIPIGMTEEDYLASIFQYQENPAYPIITRSPQGLITKINMIIPSTSQNRNSNYVRGFFVSADSTTINNFNIISQEHRIKLSNELQRNLNIGTQISISVTAGGGFSKTFVRQEYQELSKKKTFYIRIIGEVDTTIGWLTPPDLGILQLNRTSTLSVKAKSTSLDTVINYSIIGGSLPPGLTLSTTGEIVGKVPVNGTLSSPSLIFIDGGNTTFDNSLTTFDRTWNFTVLAKDRFDFNSIERTFTLTINDDDNLSYTNVYIQPFLKNTQREYVQSILNNTTIFNPIEIYRPSDPNFGLQKNLRAMVYAGIETNKLEQFVAATAKNHKKKNFFLGDVKTAIAKVPGTNEIVYEVVYVDLIDPADAQPLQTREQLSHKSKNRLKVNSDKLETAPDGNIDPWRYRPKGNTITADSNAIKVDQTIDRVKYISNITNMRKRLKSIGVTNNQFLPLWMRTAQPGSLTELGFVLALPLAYVKPGLGNTVKERILNSDIDFTRIDFEIDRYIVDRTSESDNEQFVLFANYQYNI